MRVFNIMLSRDLGGIQQAYLNYSSALQLQSHQVINISAIGARINQRLKPSFAIPNLGLWCFLSKIILKILILLYKPDIIICHGNRAISFVVALKNKSDILIGVAHNYSVKYLQRCDYVIALTNQLKQHLLQNHIKPAQLLSVPNLIHVTRSYTSPTPRNSETIVIGSIGRFVHKKGFSYLIEAINLLKNKGYKIKLLIGGIGLNQKQLENTITSFALENEVSLVGWVDHYEKFFEQIDIFCLPSLEEPFGIILLEAIECSKPILATRSGGPAEIIQHEFSGLLCNSASASDLAQGLQAMIDAPITTLQQFTYNAYNELKTTYDINVVSILLSDLLTQIIKKSNH